MSSDPTPSSCPRVASPPSLPLEDLSKELRAAIDVQALARAAERFYLCNSGDRSIYNEDDLDGDHIDQEDAESRPMEVKVADGVSVAVFRRLRDELWDHARFRRSTSGELFFTSFTTAAHHFAVAELRFTVKDGQISTKIHDVGLVNPPPGEHESLRPDVALCRQDAATSGIIVEMENTHRSVEKLCLLLHQYVYENQARVAVGVKMWKPRGRVNAMSDAERNASPVHVPVVLVAFTRVDDEVRLVARVSFGNTPIPAQARAYINGWRQTREAVMVEPEVGDGEVAHLPVVQDIVVGAGAPMVPIHWPALTWGANFLLADMHPRTFVTIPATWTNGPRNVVFDLQVLYQRILSGRRFDMSA